MTRTRTTIDDQRQRLSSNVSGAIYVEFLVAFIPVLIFFLGLLQLGLIYTANLVVRHAAVRGARAAIVVLEDDPRHYDDSPRGQISYEGSSENKSGGAQGQVVPDLGLPGELGALADFGSSRGDARLNAIRRAAYMPLGAVAPSLAKLSKTFHLGDGSSLGELGNGVRFLAGLLLYNRAAAMVTLRDKDNKVVETLGSEGDVRIHVTYLYYCGIPIVSNFMCDSVADLSGFTQASEAVMAVYDAIRAGEIREAIRAGQDVRGQLDEARGQFDRMKEELSWAENPELLVPFIFTNAHFTLIEAEATLPNQGACYYNGNTC